MRNFAKVILVLALCSVPMLSSATVLTFGPICSGSCLGAYIPAGYGGFTWDPLFSVVGNRYYSENLGNTYGAPSGGAAINNGGGPLGGVTLSSSTPFNFIGADFTTLAMFDDYIGDAFLTQSSRTVKIDAYNASGTLIGSLTAPLSPTGYNFVTANFAGVSSLVLGNDDYPYGNYVNGIAWLMDDFTYNPSTPEPGTLVMFGSGIIGLAGFLRRKIHL